MIKSFLMMIHWKKKMKRTYLCCWFNDCWLSDWLWLTGLGWTGLKQTGLNQLTDWLTDYCFKATKNSLLYSCRKYASIFLFLLPSLVYFSLFWLTLLLLLLILIFLLPLLLPLSLSVLVPSLLQLLLIRWFIDNSTR